MKYIIMLCLVLAASCGKVEGGHDTSKDLLDSEGDHSCGVDLAGDVSMSSDSSATEK